ncbi:MAG: outer membrane protein [Hyphomicrobiaceae bacterium]
MKTIRKMVFAASLLLIGGAPALAGGGASYGTGKDSKRFYAGAVIAYGWGRLEAAGDSARTRGVMGGGVVGYRLLTGQGALAIEGDVLASGVKQNLTTTYSFDDGAFERADARFGTDILGSLRLKASWGESAWRPYLTGGVAWQRLEIKYDAVESAAGRTISRSDMIKDNQYGYTLGAGIDWQAGDAYSMTLGYQYYRFKSDVRGFDATTDLHSIRLGGKLHY